MNKKRMFFNDEGKPQGAGKRSAQAKLAKAYETHMQHEAELSRAMNRWQKSRAVLHRLNKKLEGEFIARAQSAADDAFPEDHA